MKKSGLPEGRAALFAPPARTQEARPSAVRKGRPRAATEELVRVTIDLPAPLHRVLRVGAAERRSTLRALVLDALARAGWK